MKIYLEVLVILILIFIVLAWKIWYSLSKKILAKKYKPENDKSRKGGVQAPEFRGTEPIANLETESSGGSDESERRELLQATDANPTREDSNCPRRNPKGIDRLFRRKTK